MSLEMSAIPPLALPPLPRRLALYLTLGYPNWETFYRVLSLIEEAGVGCVEIGLPVRDPFMDGEVIRKSHLLVESGLTAKKAYEELSKIRKVFSSRIVLMTYEEGLKKYEVQKLPRWIYDALLCVDGVQQIGDYAGLVHIFSQSLSGKEIRQAVDESDLFAYVVSGEGKTGGTISGNSGYVETIAKIRAYSAIPAYVGFGVKSAQDVAEVLRNGADGAIIGSELIRKINSGDLRLVEQYLKSLCQKV